MSSSLIPFVPLTYQSSTVSPPAALATCSPQDCMGCLGDRDVCMINQSVQGNWLIEYSETIQRISLDASYGEGDWEEKNEHSFIGAVASLVSHAVNATWEFLDIPDGRGWTPATLAVGRDKPHLLRLLKGRGADLDQADLQNTPLTLAVRYNKIDMVRLLCELGVDLDKPDGTNRTPLSAAGEADKLEMIRLLYDLHASIDAKDGDGMTALASGVYYSKPSAVRLLLSLGANPNVLVTNSPVSPLGIALLHNRHDVCQTLRAYGANDAEGTSLAQMKRVALVWGLAGSVFHEDVNGTIHRGTLEGSMVGSLPLLSRFANVFFERSASGRLLDSEKEAIRDALSHSLEKHEESSSDQDLAERIKSKKPTLMFVTSDERAGHKIGLVFNNGKLFVCNRGAGGKRSGIKIYSYDEACITPGLISKLKGFRRLTELQEIIQPRNGSWIRAKSTIF